MNFKNNFQVPEFLAGLEERLSLVNHCPEHETTSNLPHHVQLTDYRFKLACILPNSCTMAFTAHSDVAFITFILLCSLALVFSQVSHKRNKLPGPRRIPIIGNVIATDHIWIRLAQLSLDHGLVVFGHLFLNNLTVELQVRSILSASYGATWLF